MVINNIISSAGKHMVAFRSICIISLIIIVPVQYTLHQDNTEPFIATQAQKHGTGGQDNRLDNLLCEVQQKPAESDYLCIDRYAAR